MTIREDFDYTFFDPNGAMLCLEARENQDVSLRLSSPSGQAVLVKPTREQWLELRATINHVLDAEDVTAASAVKVKEVPIELLTLPTMDQKATFERWLDKHTLDDTDFNDPPSGL